VIKHSFTIGIPSSGLNVEEDGSECQVYRYRDGDGDGKADRDTPDGVVPLSTVRPLWEAGEKLSLRNAGARTIMTFVDGNHNGAVDAGETLEFTPEQAQVLRPFLRAKDETEAAAIIRYIRGEDMEGFRKRTEEGESPEILWKLGDIVRSTPVLSESLWKITTSYTEMPAMKHISTGGRKDPSRSLSVPTMVCFTPLPEGFTIRAITPALRTRRNRDGTTQSLQAPMLRV